MSEPKATWQWPPPRDGVPAGGSAAFLDDLEAYAGGLSEQDQLAEVDDSARAARASVTLLDRLRATERSSISLRLWGIGDFSGVVDDVCSDHLVLRSAGGEAVVPLSSVVGVHQLVTSAVAPASVGRVAAAYSLTSRLRAWTRDRIPVRLVLVDGATYDGTLDRVGADHADLTRHGADSVRRGGDVTGSLTVALSAIAVIVRS